MSRVFQVDGGVTASLSGLTISGGSVSPGNGGGLANYGTATLTDCTISGNTAFSETTRKYYGYYGTYYLTHYYGGGGGVFNSGTANLTLTGCTVSGNAAGHGGGGLDNAGTANLTDCTLSGNTAFSQASQKYFGTTAIIIAPKRTARVAAWTIPARPTWP